MFQLLKIIKSIFSKGTRSRTQSRGSINRVKELKQLKKLANTFLKFYLNRKNYSENKWERDLSTRNVILLKSSIAKINKLQHDHEVKKYLTAYNYIPPNPTNVSKENKDAEFNKLAENFIIGFYESSFILLIEIVKCSPRMSYFNDLSWFTHGTVGEHIEYGLGKVDEKIFEKYLPNQLESIEKIKKTFFVKDKFKDDLVLLETILSLIEEEKFIPANILIITLIEGLVRKFASIVYLKQYPDKSKVEVDDFTYKGNSSFEALIKNNAWQKDIPVDFSKFISEYSHTNNISIIDLEEKLKKHKEANARSYKKMSDLESLISEQLEKGLRTDDEFKSIALKHVDDLKNNSLDMMSESDKTIMIGLDIYLDFLVTKFKDDRNNIIHGKYSFFSEKWRTLVYLAALDKLISKIIWYGDNVLSSDPSNE